MSVNRCIDCDSAIDHYTEWVCPDCKGSLKSFSSGVVCQGCSATFKRLDDIIDFSPPSSDFDSIDQSEIEVWNANARFYESLVDSEFHRGSLREQISVFRPFLEKIEGLVLDIGCGSGLFASELKEELPALSLLGLDYSIGMVCIAKRHFGTANVVRGTASRLPLQDNSVAAIIATGALHHLKASQEWNTMQNELHRVLKRGGVICIFDRHDSLFGQALHHFAVRARALLLSLRRVPTCASDVEPDFGLKDLKFFLDDKKYALLERKFTTNLLDFVLVCSTNLIQYLLTAGAARHMRKALRRMTYGIKTFLDRGPLCVEQILVIRKP